MDGWMDLLLRLSMLSVTAMYQGANTVVRTAYGNTEYCEVKVGMHYGSGLSPLLFVLVMEAISCKFRISLTWELLYADDLVVIADMELRPEGCPTAHRSTFLSHFSGPLGCWTTFG